MTTIEQLRAAPRADFSARGAPSVGGDPFPAWYGYETALPEGSTMAGHNPTSFMTWAPAQPFAGRILESRAACPTAVSRQNGALDDLVWVGKRIDGTSLATTTIDSVAFAARDLDGSTDGRGLRIGLWLEMNGTSLGGAAGYFTYTNSDGTAGRQTTQMTFSAQASSSWQLLYYPTLQGQDVGVRSIQSFTFTATDGVFAIPFVYLPLHKLNFETGFGTPGRAGGMTFLSPMFRQGALFFPRFTYTGTVSAQFQYLDVRVAYL